MKDDNQNISLKQEIFNDVIKKSKVLYVVCSIETIAIIILTIALILK